jgi:hypothetical protein
MNCIQGWWLGFDSKLGQKFFFSVITSILILGLISPCIQMALWHFPQDESWSEHEADHASSSSARIQNMWNFTFISSMCLHGVTVGFIGNFTISLPYVLSFIPLLFLKEIMVKSNFFCLFRCFYIVMNLLFHILKLWWKCQAFTLVTMHFHQLIDWLTSDLAN